MAELGEAIGLQGKPRIDTGAQIGRLLQLEQFDEQKRLQREQAMQKAEQQKQAEFDKNIKPYLSIDYNTIHPVFKDDALKAVTNYIGELDQLKYNRDPRAKSEAQIKGQELLSGISRMRNNSQNYFGLEDYDRKGGFMTPEDRKVLMYARTGNPVFIQGIDLNKTAAVRAFDPETKDIVWQPFEYTNPVNYASKNYYGGTKEQLTGSEGRFDRITRVYDRNAAKALALQDFDNNPKIQRIAEFEFREDALKKVFDLVDPITGLKRYPDVNEYTMKDPLFIEDYNDALKERWGEFAASLPLAEEQVLRAKPSPKSKGSGITFNIGAGGRESALAQLGFAIDQDDYYTSPNTPQGDVRFTHKYSASTQPVKMNLSGSERLFNTATGEFEATPTIKEFVTAEKTLTPVYTEGADKGKPVPNPKSETRPFEYIVGIKLLNTEGSGILQTSMPYFIPLQKVKAGYLLGLAENEKEAEQNSFTILEQEAARLNKELKQTKQSQQQMTPKKESAPTTKFKNVPQGGF